MKDIPWGLVIGSIAIAFFWRPIFPEGQDTKYMVACWLSAVVLGVISGYMKLREDEKK